MKLLASILLDAFLVALLGLLLSLLLRVLTALSFRWTLAIIGVAILMGAFTAMLLVRPSLSLSFVPTQTSASPEVVTRRGWYPPQTDPSGERYVWTQERATIVFDFLVRKPLTVSVEIRSAAVAGGPDTPVILEVNGQDVGRFRPDPANRNFQRLSVRFTPHDWGGHQTEMRLVATPFRPGNGDPRVLGTMVRSLSVDKSEAWSGIANKVWLVWALPFLAVLTAGLAWAARRRGSAIIGYAAFAACCTGALCAATIMLLIIRVGVVTPFSYRVWCIASFAVTASFIAAALALPFGSPAAPGLGRRARARLSAFGPIQWVETRAATIGAAFRTSIAAHPLRRDLARDLAYLFVFALGVRLVWVVLLPPWQATDETEHFAYVNHIVEQHAIPHPPYAVGYGPFSQELRQSLQDTNFYPLAENNRFYGKPESPLPIADYSAARTYSATGVARFDSGGSRAAIYPPLYYLFIALPDVVLHDAPIISRLFAMRAASAILGALSCLFAYLFAFEIRRTRRWGWSLGLCLALMPTFAQLGASLNNDTAVNLGAIALIWLTVRAYLRPRLTRTLAAMLGLVSGLTLLTKPTALPLLVIAGIVVLVKIAPIGRRPLLLRRERLQAFGLYATTGSLSYGPWLLFRLGYYGDLGPGLGSVIGAFRGIVRAVRATDAVGTVATISASLPTFSPPALALFQHSFGSYLQYLRSGAGGFYARFLFREFWGRLGWGGAYLPGPVLGVIAVGCAIGAAGLVIQLVRRRAGRSLLLLLIGLILLHILFIFIGVDYLQSYARTGTTLGLQGRYFFPILVPVLFLLLSGWESLLRDRALALRIAPVLMLALQLLGLGAVVTRYFGVRFG